MGMRVRWMGWARVPWGPLLASEVGWAQVPGTEGTASGWPLAAWLSLREPEGKTGMSAGLTYSSQPCPLGLLQGEPEPEWGDQVKGGDTPESG